MNKTTGPALCVYCQINRATTLDHVVPKCLFLTPLPSDMVTVPACRSCNNDKSKNDDYLRDMLIIDIHCSAHPVAQALLVGKMKRAMQNNRSKVAHTVVKFGRLEPFYTQGGVYLGHYHSAPLEEERVSEIFQTIARGLYFKLRGRCYPAGYSFEVLRYDPKHGQQLFDGMKAKGANGPYTLGQVFTSLFMYAAEDPGVTRWLMQFYGGVFVTVTTEKAVTSEVIMMPGKGNKRKGS